MGVDFRGGLERNIYLVVGLYDQRMRCLAHAKPTKFPTILGMLKKKLKDISSTVGNLLVSALIVSYAPI